MDSPRGRIVLMRAGLDEGLDEGPDEGPEGRAPGLPMETATHFDRCLGCMACVTACPSGVRYDRLIERTRAQVERNHKRSAFETALRLLLFETLPHPRRLRRMAPALAAARKMGAEKLPQRLSIMMKVAPRTSLRAVREARYPERTPAVSTQRGRVAVLLGCVQRVFFAPVHRATIGVLAAEGYEVLAPSLPDCCG